MVGLLPTTSSACSKDGVHPPKNAERRLLLDTQAIWPFQEVVGKRPLRRSSRPRRPAFCKYRSLSPGSRMNTHRPGLPTRQVDKTHEVATEGAHLIVHIAVSSVAGGTVEGEIACSRSSARRRSTATNHSAKAARLFTPSHFCSPHRPSVSAGHPDTDQTAVGPRPL